MSAIFCRGLTRRSAHTVEVFQGYLDMVASTYKTAMTHLRRDENGYVNHPRDPGGATNYGVTQAVYDAHRKRTGRPTRSVLQILEFEIDVIYRTQYAE